MKLKDYIICHLDLNAQNYAQRHFRVSHKLWRFSGETFLWNANVAFVYNLEIESMLIYPENMGIETKKQKQNELKRN